MFEIKLPEAIMLIGVFGAGKTTAAATISNQWPQLPEPVIKTGRKPFKITDTFFVGWDKDAVLPLVEAGVYDMPYKDMSRVEPNNLLNEQNTLMAELAPRVLSGEIKNVVWDGMSAFDVKIVANRSALLDDDKANRKERKDNNMVLYRQVLAWHTAFFQRAMTLPCTSLFLFQVTTKGGDPPSSDDKMREKASIENRARGIETQSLTARVTGQAWNFYHEQCGEHFFVDRKRVGAEEKRVFLTNYAGDTITRSKLRCLSGDMPADFRVIKQRVAEANTKMKAAIAAL